MPLWSLSWWDLCCSAAFLHLLVQVYLHGSLAWTFISFSWASKNLAQPGSPQHFPTNEVHILPERLAEPGLLGHSLMGTSPSSMHPCLPFSLPLPLWCEWLMSWAASHQPGDVWFINLNLLTLVCHSWTGWLTLWATVWLVKGLTYCRSGWLKLG